MTKAFYPSCCLFCLLAITGCHKNAAVTESRSFYMGVTPWPADFTVNETDTAYNFINDHCDIVSHHFDDGIPYDEAFNNQPMPANFQQDVSARKSKTATGKKIFLSVSALNLTRKEKADYYRNDPVADSIKNFWKLLAFNDTKVVTAYVNYISWLIDQFQPAYVNYGVESNVSLWDAAQFNLYKDFLSKVYTRLKTKYSSLPFFISLIVDESAEGFAYATQLLSFTDFIGLSAYPYVTVSSSAGGNTNPENFPAGYFEKFINLAPSKPLVFAETGYIAENLVISSYSLNKQGHEDWQKKYLEKIGKLCNDHHAKFLIWFCGKDYDAGSSRLHSLGLYEDLFGLWQDTGLKNEAGRERPAYQSWLQWMSKVKTE